MENLNNQIIDYNKWYYYYNIELKKQKLYYYIYLSNPKEILQKYRKIKYI